MSKKQKFSHLKFDEYASKIINHPNYSGMPDTFGDKGKIQWEAPSNRKSGRFKDTHQKRLEWWHNKAVSIGIDPIKTKSWISQTAKRIHPFNKKPCKNCGTELYISYCYPSKILIARIKKLSYIPTEFNISSTEDIITLLKRMYVAFGDKLFSDIPKLLSTSSIKIFESYDNLNDWITYIQKKYIVLEPNTLSPGAMSNAPDRLDGFHSFNRCCRESADKGRTKENLQSYTTDRRVFEYWVDGDWVASDHLMGQVRSNNTLKKVQCFNTNSGGEHPIPCQADHIGPISLGFSHFPLFQFLCKSCNSGKNNRMYLSDVELLLQLEDKNFSVISWFGKSIWDKRKKSVKNSETALRLSKLMRDNRHTYMAILKRIFDSRYIMFLTSLLSLEYADYDVNFISLDSKNHLTTYDSIEKRLRNTKYTSEQKARRIRIAFKSLSDYHKKTNRNAYVIVNQEIEDSINRLLASLENLKIITNEYDMALKNIIEDSVISDTKLRLIADDISKFIREHQTHFNLSKDIFKETMDMVSDMLSDMWESDRYVRFVNEIIE